MLGKITKSAYCVRLTKFHEDYKGYIHITVMFICYCILLGTVYSQQQQSRFVHSHAAIHSSYAIEEADGVGSFEDIWEWMINLQPHFGGRVFDEVEANCPQPDPPSKTISVDGAPVTIVDPEPNYISCMGNKRFIRHLNRSAFVAGNQEMLLYGMFTERSYPIRPINKAANDNTLIHNTRFGKISPFRDFKIIRTCSNATSMCLLSDAYKGDPGSTLQWEGQNEDGHAVYMFDNVAKIYDTETLTLRDVKPCRMYFPNEDKVVEDPLTDSDTCKYQWITDGVDMHNKCLKWTNDPPSPGWAYATAMMNETYTQDAYDKYFLCSSLNDFDFAESVYLTGMYNLQDYLPIEEVFGTFFDIETQEDYMVDFNNKFMHLNMHSYFDENTRHVLVYLLSRNLSPHELFYTMTTLSFNIKTNGLYTTTIDIEHAPIIQFTYGANGYDWLFPEVLVFEILVLIVIGVVTLRTVYLIVTVGFTTAKKISPKVERNEDSIRNTQAAEGSNTNGHVTMGIKDVEMDAHSPPCKEEMDGRMQGGEANEITSAPPLQPKASTLKNSETYTMVPDDYAYGKVLDVVMLVILSIGIMYRVMYCFKCADLHNFMISLNGDYDIATEDIISKFSSVAATATSIKVVSIVAIVSGLLQFFRYVSVDSRLNIVTSTLWSSTEDLMPVFGIFIVVLVSYGVLGTEIYGDKLVDWSNLGRSLSTMFLIVLGEFGPYFDMKKQNPTETTFYFWSFITIILFLLLNMVLAVIFSVYDNKHEELRLQKEKDKGKKKNVGPLNEQSNGQSFFGSGHVGKMY